MVRKFSLWALLVAVAGAAGAWFSWSFSTPADMHREARSFAILAVGILVSGTLLICATRRFWFMRRRPHKHGHPRGGGAA